MAVVINIQNETKAIKETKNSAEFLVRDWDELTLITEEEFNQLREAPKTNIRDRVEYAICLLQAIHCKKDVKTAFEIFEENKEKSFAAQYYLIRCVGQKYEDRPYNEELSVQCFHKLREAAAEKNPEANFYLGMCFNLQKGYSEYEGGNFFERQNYLSKHRFQCFRIAATSGNPAAQIALAQCYGDEMAPLYEEHGWWGEFGEWIKWAKQPFQKEEVDVRKKYQEDQMFHWYKAAAQQGDAWALCFLGDCYAKNVGVPEREYVGVGKSEQARLLFRKQKSFDLMKKAALQQVIQAQLYLASIYQINKDIPEEEYEGIMHEVADWPNGPEAEKRKLAYRNQQAFLWYKAAAKRGDPLACHRVAWLSLQNREAPEGDADPKKAWEKFKLLLKRAKERESFELPYNDLMESGFFQASLDLSEIEESPFRICALNKREDIVQMLIEEGVEMTDLTIPNLLSSVSPTQPILDLLKIRLALNPCLQNVEDEIIKFRKIFGSKDFIELFKSQAKILFERHRNTIRDHLQKHLKEDVDFSDEKIEKYLEKALNLLLSIVNNKVTKINAVAEAGLQPAGPAITPQYSSRSSPETIPSMGQTLERVERKGNSVSYLPAMV